MKNSIQITITDLEKILAMAKQKIANDSDLSRTIEITRVKECDTHLGSDTCRVFVKSSYAECNSKEI
jgi:hypothetical protein